MEQIERDLLEQSCRVATLEHGRVKRPRLSIGHKQSVAASIARLVGAKTLLERRFIHIGGNYAGGGAERLVWREIDTASENRILTGVVINTDYIEPRQFLGDACDIVLERVQDVLQIRNIVKVNTAFNGEFVTCEKRADKSINTRNCELFRTTDLREWYEQRVIEPTLASLEEFQERDSG
ncbi:PREDICTED: uncharacterized protein LOC105566490 [Vollenhovia emeryi]|uniref:uncharacterized protein LOC105566490 n=1 Tax=Vollenhovia emeryi TaxID=411798 RepID=UPI0005F40CDD|nr:PREDICTED: uncharacterized protein LOC105566490 [Vollenhovia emeryi]